jgi:hypothetical protein
MFIAEFEIGGNHTYIVEDIFGMIIFRFPVRLDPDIHDEMTTHILQTRTTSSTTNEQIEYTFKTTQLGNL